MKKFGFDIGKIIDLTWAKEHGHDYPELTERIKFLYTKNQMSYMKRLLNAGKILEAQRYIIRKIVAPKEKLEVGDIAHISSFKSPSYSYVELTYIPQKPGENYRAKPYGKSGPEVELPTDLIIKLARKKDENF
jgi:hypothetical protein